MFRFYSSEYLCFEREISEPIEFIEFGKLRTQFLSVLNTNWNWALVCLAFNLGEGKDWNHNMSKTVLRLRATMYTSSLFSVPPKSVPDSAIAFFTLTYMLVVWLFNFKVPDDRYSYGFRSKQIFHVNLSCYK